MKNLENTDPIKAERKLELRTFKFKENQEHVRWLRWLEYALWLNAILFTAGWRGFAMLASLQESPPHEDIHHYKSLLLLGLTLLGLLIFRIYKFYELDQKKKYMFIFDENLVTLTVGHHEFNLGMLEWILWDRDFRFCDTSNLKKKFFIRMFISYRTGDRFEGGQLQVFKFETMATGQQMADLQKAYIRVMLIVKTRRKFQRENQKFIKTKSWEDVLDAANKVAELHSPDLIDKMRIWESDDPLDQIPMILPHGQKHQFGNNFPFGTEHFKRHYKEVFIFIAIMVTALNLVLGNEIFIK